MDLLSAEYFQERAYKLGHVVFTAIPERPLNLNVIGWRSRKSRADSFDDYLALYWVETDRKRGPGYQKWNERVYEASTLPGVPWLLNPISSQGTAVLVPGQYIQAYELGYFRGVRALRQTGPVKVYRDKNRDGVVQYNDATIQEGYFGLHIHRAGILSKVVGRSSAGCQVFKRHRDWREFMDTVEVSSLWWGTKFTYTLMEF